MRFTRRFFFGVAFGFGQGPKPLPVLGPRPFGPVPSLRGISASPIPLLPLLRTPVPPQALARLGRDVLEVLRGQFAGGLRGNGKHLHRTNLFIDGPPFAAFWALPRLLFPEKTIFQRFLATTFDLGFITLTARRCLSHHASSVSRLASRLVLLLSHRRRFGYQQPRLQHESVLQRSYKVVWGRILPLRLSRPRLLIPHL